METRFLDLSGTIVRIKQAETRDGMGKEHIYKDGVILDIIELPSTVETEMGLSQIPSEHIQVYGVKNLVKLADEIKNFCLLHDKECEKE